MNRQDLFNRLNADIDAPPLNEAHWTQQLKKYQQEQVEPPTVNRVPAPLTEEEKAKRKDLFDRLNAAIDDSQRRPVVPISERFKSPYSQLRPPLIRERSEVSNRESMVPNEKPITKERFKEIVDDAFAPHNSAFKRKARGS